MELVYDCVTSEGTQKMIHEFCEQWSSNGGTLRSATDLDEDMADEVCKVRAVHLRHRTFDRADEVHVCTFYTSHAVLAHFATT